MAPRATDSHPCGLWSYQKCSGSLVVSTPRAERLLQSLRETKMGTLSVASWSIFSRRALRLHVDAYAGEGRTEARREGRPGPTEPTLAPKAASVVIALQHTLAHIPLSTLLLTPLRPVMHDPSDTDVFMHQDGETTSASEFSAPNLALPLLLPSFNLPSS